jgi:hypothetical protein
MSKQMKPGVIWKLVQGLGRLPQQGPPLRYSQQNVVIHGSVRHASCKRCVSVRWRPSCARWAPSGQLGTPPSQADHAGAQQLCQV